MNKRRKSRQGGAQSWQIGRICRGEGGGRLEMQLWSLLLPLALLCTALASGPECGMDERSRRARRDTRHSRQLLYTAPGTCATRLARGRRSTAGLEPGHVPRRRQQREVEDGEESLTPSRALYFSGQGDQLRLKADIELPRDAFTLQVWLKAEGGQRSPAVIAGRSLAVPVAAASLLRFGSRQNSQL